MVMIFLFPPFKKKEKKKVFKYFPNTDLSYIIPEWVEACPLLQGSLRLCLILFSIKASGCVYCWWHEFGHPQKWFGFLSLMLCRECLFLFVKDTWSCLFLKTLSYMSQLPYICQWPQKSVKDQIVLIRRTAGYACLYCSLESWIRSC